MDASRLRRWVQDKRVVEARERAEARSGAAVFPDSIAQALALTALFGRLHGWPALEDEVSQREDARMYERWHCLKTALRPR